MTRQLACFSVSFFSVLGLLTCCRAAQAAQSGAADLVRQSLQQMGGENAMRSVNTVRFEARGYRNALEQSERPEGPYIVEYQSLVDEADFQHARSSRETELRWQALPPVKQKDVVAGGAAMREFDGHAIPGTDDQLQFAEERLELGPERILFTALAAGDLHSASDTTLQSVPHHAISFTWKGVPVTVFLNADTMLPTAVEWTRAYPANLFWGIWGDVTTRVYYSLWWLCPGGIHYPLQWDTYRNGMQDSVLTVSPTELTLNARLAESEFGISTDMQGAFHKRVGKTADDRPLGPGIEIAPDVIFFAGAWNTTLIRQADGIVVLEAPISSGYSAQVIAEAQKRWPRVAIKAAITTSDSWPHIGGVREYVARGIPVYALDRNLPILQRLLAAPRAAFPDALAKASRQPQFHAVSGKTALGEGANRLEIYPLHGETSERQMMVYFPERRLLYGSDAFQIDPSGALFVPQTVWEVRHAVERENLSVDKFFMMHMPATAWSELDKAQAKNGEEHAASQ